MLKKRLILDNMNDLEKAKCRISKENVLTIAKEILNSGYKLNSTTAGASMYPIVRKDDFVTIKPIAFEEISLGDIIAAARKNIIVLHRVIYKERKYVVIKGDISFNNISREKIERNNVIGILEKVNREGQEVYLDSKKYAIYKSLVTILSRHFPICLLIPAVVTRIFSTPQLFFKKSIHWFRKIFLKKRYSGFKRNR